MTDFLVIHMTENKSKLFFKRETMVLPNRIKALILKASMRLCHLIRY